MARSSVTVEGLDTLVARLKALGPAASQRGGPVRAAVRKAAVVIQKQAQANIRGIIAEPNIGGKNVSTGTLEKNVKAMRQRAHKELKGESYIVTVPRRARYPVDERTPTGIGVATVGKMLEYGTSKMRPHKWMGPAFHAKKEEAVDAMSAELLKGVEKLERQVASRVR